MQNHPVIDMEQIAHQLLSITCINRIRCWVCAFFLSCVHFALALCSIKAVSKQQCNEIHKRKRKQKQHTNHSARGRIYMDMLDNVPHLLFDMF